MTSNREKITELIEEKRSIINFINNAKRNLDEQIKPYYSRCNEIEKQINETCEHIWKSTLHCSEHTEYRCEVCGIIETCANVYAMKNMKKNPNMV